MNDGAVFLAPNNQRKRSLALAVWSGLTIIAVVLASRKLAGAFQHPISEATACCLAFLSSALSVCAFALAEAGSNHAPSLMRRVSIGFLTLVPPAAIGVVLLPAASTTGTTCLLSLFLLSSAVLFVPTPISTGEQFTADPALQLASSMSSPISSDVQTSRMTESQPTAGTDVRQWMNRTLSDNGEEVIEGSLQIEFKAGQKQTHAHIAFTPPFPCVPEIECEILADSPVQVRIAAVHTYGGRLELRRSTNFEMTASVELAFAASAKAVRCNDAA